MFSIFTGFFGFIFTGSLCFICLVFKKKLISFFVRLDPQFCPFSNFWKGLILRSSNVSFLWGKANFNQFFVTIEVGFEGGSSNDILSPFSFKLSSSDFLKLFSSSVNWLSKSLSILSFLKLNKRSSFPSAKWRFSSSSEKIGFNILYQLDSFSGAKPLPFLHLSKILRHSSFSVVYFLRSFFSKVSIAVYSLTTPFAFVKFSASLTSVKWFSLCFWSNIF